MTTPQADVAIWNDNVRINIDSNPPRIGRHRRANPCYIEREELITKLKMYFGDL